MNNKSTDNVQEKSSTFESLDILFRKWKEGTFKEIIDDWRWIFSYSKRYKAAISFYLLLGIFSSSMGLVTSIAGKYLIDIITGYQTSKLWIMVLIMVGSSSFGLIFGSIINRITTKLNIYINNDIQADIFDKIIDADWMSINQYSNGDILNRFTGDIGTVSSNAISWLPSIIIALYQFIATFFVILHYDTLMAFIAFGSAPFLLLVSRLIIKKQRDYSKKVREMSSKVMTFEVETFYNMDTIKSFGITSLYGEKLRHWQQLFKGISLEYNWFSIKTNIYMSIVGMLVEFLAFGYCLFRLWTHQITFGTMTLFLQQRVALSGSFQSLISIIPSFLNSSVSAHRIRELVELPKDLHLQESSVLESSIVDGLSIHIKKVDFAYIKGKTVVKNSSLDAYPGEIIAIIGPSGGGKTTLVRLILGLIFPTSGEVVIKSSNGSKVQMNANTRHLFSYVPQGNTILSGTIAENMRLVKPNATNDEIISALKTACAWDFIEKLPQSINSVIGERGKGLSEGQAQRIAIARALLRNSPILLLDEATSALDVTTERSILRNIMNQYPNKICIVTTHRPTVLTMCKRVYRVMDSHVTTLTDEESEKLIMDF